MTFSPRQRSKIIAAVHREGTYSGKVKGLPEYVLYRSDRRILLLIRNGRTWHEIPQRTVFDALNFLEKIEEKRCLLSLIFLHPLIIRSWRSECARG